jgi:uncharacterized protein
LALGWDRPPKRPPPHAAFRREGVAPLVSLLLTVLPDELTIYRLPPTGPVPVNCFEQTFCAVTKTADEVSVVTVARTMDETGFAPKCISGGWRALVVQGPLDFALTGILSALATPLAQAGIPIFAISTFDTDYLLVKQIALPQAVDVLQLAGHTITAPSK